MLIVTIPDYCQNQITYSLNVLLKCFLGLDFIISDKVSSCIEIRCQSSIKVLSVDVSFFSGAVANWLKSDSLPLLPLRSWKPQDDNLRAKLVNEELPILYGEGLIVDDGDHVQLGIDIFGSAFFMLSRYEELVVQDRDNHDRFPGISSLAYKANFLDRPIINEYLEVLWFSMSRLWPALDRKKRTASIRVSCDVDDPFDSLVNKPLGLLKTALMDVIKRRDIILAFKRVLNAIIAPLKIYNFDPYNTFDWYMDACERNGLKATFYFIVNHTAGKIDGEYSIQEQRIQELIERIISRGHNVGVHGSYNTYRDGGMIAYEKKQFDKFVIARNKYAKPIGIRQHYLRVDYSVTQDYFERAGYSYDTTGGYADVPGFRFGVCYSFPMWSWLESRQINLIQRPLIVMEVAAFSLYPPSDVLYKLNILKANCYKFNGDFSLLWHNSQFYSNRFSIFPKIISTRG